jgi:DNA (cytosine-5)-methyltransferase 1
MVCKWQTEIDDFCNKVLEKHWPDVRRHRDVREVGKHNLESVDLICGGFPCQDLSIAGNRKGLSGERSGLWFEFERIINEIEPKWIIIENVPGLLSSNKGKDFAVIIRWLAERGYGVCWRIFDAQYFGVPQRRRRLFIVGSFGNGNSAKVLFEKYESHPILNEATSAPVATTLTTKHSRRWDDTETVVEEIDGLRWLMPVECERLQGFPDGWTGGQSDSMRYKQLGNAVVPQVVEFIGKAILEVT